MEGKKEKIIVERVRRFSESRYSVGIYVDGEFIVNTLKENRQIIEVGPGKHIIKVEQGMKSGELEINVQKGKTSEYQFSASYYSALIFSLFLFSWVFNQLFENPAVGFLLFIFAIIASIYAFTKGKRKYYTIRKVDEYENYVDN